MSYKDCGNIYLIKLFDQKEEFYKIGTTVHRYCRFYEIMKVGYQVLIVYMVFDIDKSEYLLAENNLQRLFHTYVPLKKFGGYTECFSNVDTELFERCLFRSVTHYGEITENLLISWR